MRRREFLNTGLLTALWGGSALAATAPDGRQMQRDTSAADALFAMQERLAVFPGIDDPAKVGALVGRPLMRMGTSRSMTRCADHPLQTSETWQPLKRKIDPGPDDEHPLNGLPFALQYQVRPPPCPGQWNPPPVIATFTDVQNWACIMLVDLKERLGLFRTTWHGPRAHIMQRIVDRPDGRKARLTINFKPGAWDACVDDVSVDLLD